MCWVDWMDDPDRPARQELLAQKAERGEPVEWENVELDPANADAAAIYMLTRNQVVTVGEGQPVDVNIVAVKAAMDAHGIPDQRACLAMVVSIWRQCDAKRRGEKR